MAEGLEEFYRRNRRQPEARPPAGPSRRRSLPALAKVQTRVETMRDKALSRLEKAEQHDAYTDAALMRERVWALGVVLGFIAEVEREEPEGNTEVSQREADVES